MTEGSVKTKVNDTRSRANQTKNAVYGVLLVLLLFPSPLANILANAESLAIPHVMLTSVTMIVARKPNEENGATVLAAKYVEAYTNNTHRNANDCPNCRGCCIMSIPRWRRTIHKFSSPLEERVMASSKQAMRGATTHAVVHAATPFQRHCRTSKEVDNDDDKDSIAAVAETI